MQPDPVTLLTLSNYELFAVTIYGREPGDTRHPNIRNEEVRGSIPLGSTTPAPAAKA